MSRCVYLWGRLQLLRSPEAFEGVPDLKVVLSIEIYEGNSIMAPFYFTDKTWTNTNGWMDKLDQSNPSQILQGAWWSVWAYQIIFMERGRLYLQLFFNNITVKMVQSLIFDIGLLCDTSLDIIKRSPL